MDAQRVEVFHAGHGEAMVVGIADDLELDFFPAFQGFFYQNLRGEGEGTFSQFDEFFLIGADTASQTSQRISRTDHDRIADRPCGFECIPHVFHCPADGSLEGYFVEFLDKQVAVFCVHDGIH